MPLESPIYVAQRIGKGRQRIHVYKLRTMSGDTPSNISKEVAEQRMGGAQLEAERTSLLGAALRLLAFDEIPQVVNWVRGEMKLVGLRPLPPKEFATLPPDIQAYYDTNLPGLIGGGYAFLRSNGSFDDQVSAQRAYLAYSRKLDQMRQNGEMVRYVTLSIRLAIIAYINHILSEPHWEVLRRKIGHTRP